MPFVAVIRPIAPPLILRPDVVARVRTRRLVAAPVAESDIQPVAEWNAEPSALATEPPAPTAAQVTEPPAEPAASSRAYAIGYKKPPRHSQFKKGQSGNRKGRPRGARGIKTLAREMLTQQVVVRTASGPTRMTKIEAMLHKVLEAAFNGNLRAMQSLLQLYSVSVPDDAPIPPALAPGSAGGDSAAVVIDMDAHDRAILEMLRQNVLAEAAGGSS